MTGWPLRRTSEAPWSSPWTPSVVLGDATTGWERDHGGIHRGRSTTMRPDITIGSTFPDYELPDHTKVPRKLSEIQGDDPLILTLARGHYCPKEHQQHLHSPRSTRRSPSPTPRSPPSRPTTITPARSSVRRSAPSGPSCPTRSARSSGISTSPSTPTRNTTR